jgi:uncharacterized protein
MSSTTLRIVAQRIAEHVRTHRLNNIRVVLHGGEPLLAGRDFIAEIAAVLRETIPAGGTVEITAQTNGVLLDEELLAVLLEHRIGVGVSLDGPPDAHDRHRRHRNGQASHSAVARALRLLGGDRFRPLFRGLLCTVDLTVDPLSVYENLLSFAPPAVDFLLPHGNWSNPPPGRCEDPSVTPYADWLAVLFDRWYPAPPTRIRLFEAIMDLLLGMPSSSEAVGLSPSTLVVVETDGSIEQTDALKSAFEGAAATGLNVRDHTFDLALRHPGIVARQVGLAALHEDCLGCDIRDVCGGGLYPQRYRAGAGFRNPTVYCPDHLALIRHIRAGISSDLSRLRPPG